MTPHNEYGTGTHRDQFDQPTAGLRTGGPQQGAPDAAPAPGPVTAPDERPPGAAHERPAAPGTVAAPAAGYDTGNGYDNGAGLGNGTGYGNGAAPHADEPGRHAGHRETLLPHGERDRLGEQLHHAVNTFVDSPHESVEAADGVLEQAVRNLTDSLNERRHTLREPWQGGGAKGETEELRLALRQYRELTERLLAL
ncbi:hypothetical protein V1J52_02730 [Streptomyces sp. TRM 70351]|uniref:hypothetical protein n=1 Tax=Streptomyces sp. TRM 70351 TaxID=3116552 RepID=UPI002E7B127C|nr:hypothetical protein [Streptomyces sp. TRM 70351]MEE1927107.1 hypothetical protein [Streptomyces sp. TRM 70351]